MNDDSIVLLFFSLPGGKIIKYNYTSNILIALSYHYDRREKNGGVQKYYPYLKD